MVVTPDDTGADDGSGPDTGAASSGQVSEASLS